VKPFAEGQVVFWFVEAAARIAAVIQTYQATENGRMA
jgi:hypothetical protein